MAFILKAEGGRVPVFLWLTVVGLTQVSVNLTCAPLCSFLCVKSGLCARARGGRPLIALSLSLSVCVSLPPPLSLSLCNPVRPVDSADHIQQAEVRLGNAGLLLVYSYRSAVPSYRATMAGAIGSE